MKETTHTRFQMPEHITTIMKAIRPRMENESYNALVNFMEKQHNVAQANRTSVAAVTAAELQVRNLDRELVIARKRIAELESRG